MATNDLDGGSDEPSYLHVAMCVGSDADGEPVTVVDRLCLNNAAAVQISNDLIRGYDMAKQCRELTYECAMEVDRKDASATWFKSIAGAELVVIFILVCLVLSGLKRTA